MKLNGTPNKLTHRKLILNSGEITVNKSTKITAAKQTSSLALRPDKFRMFKEECTSIMKVDELPSFSKSTYKNARHSLDVKSRLRTL